MRMQPKWSNRCSHSDLPLIPPSTSSNQHFDWPMFVDWPLPLPWFSFHSPGNDNGVERKWIWLNWPVTIVAGWLAEVDMVRWWAWLLSYSLKKWTYLSKACKRGVPNSNRPLPPSQKNGTSPFACPLECDDRNAIPFPQWNEPNLVDQCTRLAL